MNRLKLVSLIALLAFGLLATVSCKESSECFDEQMYREHKDDVCPQNCPGIVGCDGNAYCNECEANKHGIRAGR